MHYITLIPTSHTPRLSNCSFVGISALLNCHRASTVEEVLGGDTHSHHIIGEAKKNLSWSGPLIVASLLKKFIYIQVIYLFFVGHNGHLGELPLSGPSVAISFAAITGSCILELLEDVVGGISVIVNLGAFYMVGIPRSALLAFFLHLNVQMSTMADEMELGERVRGRRHMVIEGKKQFWLSCPLIIANILEKLIQVISLMFVGHLGELPLSGASMATSFIAVTGFSLLMGMGSALDTLCGQAFGAKQYHLLGIYLQRAMLVLSLVSIPLAFIWAFAGNILKVLGQEKEISLAAMTYARYMIPVLFAYALSQCHYRFLQAQNIVFPMMLCSAFTVIFHIFLCWILVVKLRIGFKGAAIANSVSYCISTIIIATYVRLSPSCKETWTGLSKDAIHDISSFIRLAIPSALMICLEFWTFEAVVLMAGLLPNPKLETSVLAICLNSSSLAFMIPFGIGASVSTRVSNELGADQPRNAWLAVIVGEIIAISEGVVVGSTLILGRHFWGRLYSNEKEVVNYVAKMAPFFALSNFIDATQSVLTGTARGCGWQKLGVVVNLGAYYVVGIPSSILLAFYFHLKGKGLWLGIICGLSVQVVLLLIITLCTNWEKQAKKATERINNSINIHLANVDAREEERSDNGH